MKISAHFKILWGSLRNATNSFVLEKFGYKLVKLDTEQFDSLSIAQVVDWAVNTLPSVKCLQIGAHDGVAGDHLTSLRPRPNWSSWLLEPDPQTFRSLQANTQSERNTTCLPFALVPSDKFATPLLYQIDPSHPELVLPAFWVSSQLSSLRRDKVEKELLNLLDRTHIPPEWIKAIPVQTVDWLTLLQQTSQVAPDLILIDAEGLDGELINSFPFDQFIPKVIVFEQMWASDDEYSAALTLLRKNGYSIFAMRFDTVAIQQNLIESNIAAGRKGLTSLK